MASNLYHILDQKSGILYHKKYKHINFLEKPPGMFRFVALFLGNSR